MNIVHIGFPKTATTFLQWHVFPNLEGIEYISFHDCRTIFQPIIYADPLDYSLDQLKSKLGRGGGKYLYSFEALTGSPFYYKGIGRSNIPGALKKMGFEKVIVTIRNQEKAIDSYYRQYVIQGGTLGFKEWLDIDNCRPLPQKYFNMEYLKYDKLLDIYVTVFGKENVLLLPQELLKNDSNDFISQLEAFTGTSFIKDNTLKKANQSLTNLSVRLLRFMNHFAYSSVSPYHLFSNSLSNRPIWKIFAILIDPFMFKLISKRESYVNKYKLEDRIKNFYKESNKRLLHHWHVDYTK